LEERKMKKAIAGIAIICLMLFVLTSCYSGIGKADMQITSVSGAGTRTFSMEILKDGAVNPDDSQPVAEMFTQNGYFPQGINAVVTLLNAKKPAGVPTIAMEEKSDRYILSYTISFSSIDDFNTKVKAIAGQYWDANSTEPATLTSSSVTGGTSLAYTEDVQLTYTCNLWASHALFDDTTGVYNVTLANANGLTPDGATAIFYTDKVSINIGGTITNYDKTATAITGSGTIATPVSSSSSSLNSSSSQTSSAVSSTASTTPKNPNTGNSVGAFAIMFVFATIAAGTVFSVKKLHN
jgi:predicted small secreted protein